MKSVFVFIGLLGLVACKPGFRFGTRYGNQGALNYIPSSVVSTTQAPYAVSSLFGNSFGRAPTPKLYRISPTSRPNPLVQFAPVVQTYLSPIRRQNQPPRISETLLSSLPFDTGFISSTAVPPIFGFGGGFGSSTPAPVAATAPVDSINFNPFPVEVSNSGEPSVFEIAPEPEVNKHFYIHSAPDEPDEVVHKHFTIGKPQKNYRVVFIKAPSPNAQASISAAFAPKEEKTIIYVLSKKPNQVEIKDIVTPPPTEPSKPEVVFIKYKTKEEAIHAQQTIQAQYDQLGGTSQVSDEGYAPISSVVGVLGQSDVNQNDVLADNVIAVTPNPSAANGIYPLKENYELISARSDE